MSIIKIRRVHTLSPERARAAAEKMAARLNQAFDMEFIWEEEVLRFQRSGVEGYLILGHREVVIDAQLDFLLAMLQPSIEQSIHENLDRIFGAARKAQRSKTAPTKKAKKKVKRK